MKKISLPISFFTAGLVSTSVQIILTREFLTVLYGNELSFAFIYFFWFLSIGAGAYLASKMSGIFRPGFLIFLFIALCVLPPLQIYAIRSFRVLIDAAPGEWISLSYVLIASMITIPFGLTIGLIFPCATWLGPKEIKQMSQNTSTSAGFVYSLESLGSTFAGIVISLVCLKYLSHFSIIRVTASICLITASFLVSLIPDKRRIWAIVIIIPATLFLSFGSFIDRSSLDLRWKSISKLEKVEETDSVYQNISVGKGLNQYSIYGNGSYITSFPDEYGAQSKAHFLMSLHPDPKRILIASEGQEELVPFILQYRPELVHIVQIDSKVHNEITKYLNPQVREAINDKRVTLFFEDVRGFIKSSSKGKIQRYDLIISLPPDPTTLNLNRFFTFEFFTKVEKLLTRDGIFVTSVTSTESYILGDIGIYLGSVYKTLKTVFQNTFVIPGTIAYLVSSTSGRNLTYDIKEISKRFDSRRLESRKFSKHNLTVYFQGPRIRQALEILGSNLPRYMVNKDLRPATYIQNLRIMGVYAGRLTNSILGALLSVNKYYIYGLVLIILTICLIFMLTKGRSFRMKFNALATIGTTGLLAFAVQLVILYFYQSQYGYIYQKLGLVVGFFMLGLWGGSSYGNRLIQKEGGKSIKTILVLETLIAIFLLILPLIFKLAPYELIIFLSSASIGLLAGMEFPVANSVYLGETDLVDAASKIDSLDHLGAALGALVTGLILVPVLGITMTFVFLFSIKAGTLMLWTTVLKGR